MLPSRKIAIHDMRVAHFITLIGLCAILFGERNNAVPVQSSTESGSNERSFWPVRIVIISRHTCVRPRAFKSFQTNVPIHAQSTALAASTLFNSLSLQSGGPSLVGRVSNTLAPSGIVIHGCLLLTKKWASGTILSFSHSVPARRKRILLLNKRCVAQSRVPHFEFGQRAAPPPSPS